MTTYNRPTHTADGHEITYPPLSNVTRCSWCDNPAIYEPPAQSKYSDHGCGLHEKHMGESQLMDLWYLAVAPNLGIYVSARSAYDALKLLNKRANNSRTKSPDSYVVFRMPENTHTPWVDDMMTVRWSWNTPKLADKFFGQPDDVTGLFVVDYKNVDVTGYEVLHAHRKETH